MNTHKEYTNKCITALVPLNLVGSAAKSAIIRRIDITYFDD